MFLYNGRYEGLERQGIPDYVVSLREACIPLAVHSHGVHQAGTVTQAHDVLEARHFDQCNMKLKQT